MVHETSQSALLPAGFHDLLPPDAAHEADAVEAVIDLLARHGYDRVKPPLVEFEETLLSGFGAAMAPETFRVLDPISRHMMAVRADMTLQIARIARSRLPRAPRPLRLSYAGQVLRVKGSQLRPERQFAQVGAELIGAPQAAGDAEVACLAVEALAALGIDGLSLDLTVPPLVAGVMAEAGLSEPAAAELRAALDRKDSERVSALAGPPAGPTLLELMAATGPAAEALDRTRGLALPAEAAAILARLDEVVGLIAARRPELTVTVDLVEHRGFEYHRGISFTLFGREVRGELGRGGRYVAGGDGGGPDPAGETGSAATGFTLYMDSVLRAAPPPRRSRRLFVPSGTEPETADAFRRDGWVTLAGLDADVDPLAEALRLGCDHVLRDGRAQPLSAG
ncbi:MAG: ATP phosphoribosyltransferase regulatory subunit [Alphaproteobacteria bacterium]|jgi:ATP phosphoribosyltransferase regulatory subunit|nr:ATP phosphoribosyltransferase regulatory subunit [Alphaproteobacteria bacterium]